MINKVSVCLEVDVGGTGAFVPDYPGCWIFGRTPRSALRKVKLAVDEWLIMDREAWSANGGKHYVQFFVSTAVHMEAFELNEHWEVRQNG